MKNALQKRGDLLTLLGSYALYALVFTLPLERIPSIDLLLGSSSVTLRANSIFAVSLILLSAPLLWRKRKDLLHMPYIGLITFLFVYLLSVALSTVLSRAVMVYGFTALTVMTAISIAFQLTPERLSILKKVLYWATWLVLIFGFYQYLGDLLGLSSSWTGLRDAYTKLVFGFPRIQSTGLEPLYYANFLLIPFFVFAADFTRGKDERPILLAAIVVQITLTVSRGAFAGAFAGVIMLILFALRNKMKLVQVSGLVSLMILGVVLALGMTSIDLGKRANTKETGEKKTEAIVTQATNFDTQDDRDRNRGLALQATREYPFFGLGPGGFDTFARARVAIYKDAPGKLIVNNEPLELLAEGGIISFLVLGITLLWIFVKSAWSICRRNVDDRSWPWLAGITCYLIALAVQYQTFSTLYIMHIWVAIGILIGCIKLNTSNKKAVKNKT